MKRFQSRMQVFIRHLFVSAGHNFFGHHGGPAGTHPTVPLPHLQCRAGRGIEGDRFFDYKPDYRGQITFFDFRVYEEIKRALHRPQLLPDAFRRNVLVEGLDLAALMGARFSLGVVEFEGCSESAPCHWMDQAVGPGAETWLKGRGGLRAKILKDGTLRVGEVAFSRFPAPSTSS
jgi:MOSC domain-containing protein YiiM